MKIKRKGANLYTGIITVLSLLLAVSLVGNALLAREQEDRRTVASADESQEEYIYLPVFKNDPIIVEQDIKGLEAFAKEMGVKVSVEAPQSYDVVETAKLLEKAIQKKPKGIMICATEENLIPYINEAAEAGIPVITVDSDLPESKRLAYIGSDWYQIGRKQAEALIKLIGGKGTVAVLGIIGNRNSDNAWAGFCSVMEEYEDILVLDMYDDVSNWEEAKRMTKEILKEYPQIKGIAGVDSNSAKGICEALEEEKKIGQVKVVSVDMTSQHIELLKKGYVQKLIGQKRELFTYYGGKLLYDYNHNQLQILNENQNTSITNIPQYIDTGIVELEPEDVK